VRIDVIAVGRLKERFWEDACAEYLKRLKGYAQVTVREVPDRDPATHGGVAAARQAEARDLMRALPARAFTVVLDRCGRETSSEDTAELLRSLQIDGQSHVAFVVGGSTGVSEAVTDKAGLLLSFGPLTLPHNLARVVLLEQIYRAFKILRNEPYHK